MSDHDQDHDEDHDDLHQEPSMSNEDFHQVSSDAAAHVPSPPTGNNCPCLPTAQQKEISQALFKVPEGFQALLKHITRELLNAKPKDPYVYIADYLRHKLNDKRRGLLEQEFFQDDTLNIDIKPPMHYLQQTSLANVTCPSTSAFDALASDAATTLQASYRGMKGRGEVQEVKRDPDRQPQGDEQLLPSTRWSNPNTSARGREACANITPALLEGCGYGATGQRTSLQQRANQGNSGNTSNQWPNKNSSRGR